MSSTMSIREARQARQRAEEARIEKEAAERVRDLSSRLKRTSSSPNDFGGFDHELGTGQVVRICRDDIDIDVHVLNGHRLNYTMQLGQAPVPVQAAAVQAAIDHELDRAIARGQAAARKAGLA